MKLAALCLGVPVDVVVRSGTGRREVGEKRGRGKRLERGGSKEESGSFWNLHEAARSKRGAVLRILSKITDIL
jgi:hypothetical protein